jgi:hypothetical protein
VGAELGLGHGEFGGEWFVVEDAGDPLGKVVPGTVVAQHPTLAADELVFQVS